MKRKDMLYIFAALVSCIMLGCLLMVTWVIVIIPAMINPRIIPDPRPKITAAITRRAFKAMNGGFA
jgi:hypothetical protein